MNSDHGGGEWGTMSRTLERLNDANALLARARAESETSAVGLLCGCASLLLVNALEEELSLIIRTRTEELRRSSAAGAPNNGFNWNTLRKKDISPWQRVRETPLRLSGGRLGLRMASTHVAALQELLALRNTLMHNTPDNIFEVDLDTGEWIQSGSTSAGIAADGKFTPGQRRGSLPALPWAIDPWRKVSPISVDRFMDAVRHYVDEIQELDMDEDGTFTGSEVLGPSASQRHS